MSERYRRLLRALDALPVWPTRVAGVAAGAAAGAALMWEPSPARFGMFVGLAAVTVPLAYFARPAVERAPAARQPAPVPPGTATEKERSFDPPPTLPDPPHEVPVATPAAAAPVETATPIKAEALTPRISHASWSPSRSDWTSLPLAMMSIPGGSVWMGSRDDETDAYEDERPRHQVEVAPFEMARVPVTEGQFEAVMGKRPGPARKPDLPATNVDWFVAVAFCNALSKREGLVLAYGIRGKDVTWDREASGYRLPTEAEWEYACRAGTETRWSFGDDEAALGEHAWYGGNSEFHLWPVGRKWPNPRGLLDMHGNVWEWCWDYHGLYPTVSMSGSGRVLRGGSFNDDPWVLRSARRLRFAPARRDEDVGFRCVRSSSRQR